MVGLPELLALIKANGLSITLLGLFIWLYINQNKKQIEIVLKFQDDNLEITRQHIEGLNNVSNTLNDKMGKVEGKVEQIIFLLQLKDKGGNDK